MTEEQTMSVQSVRGSDVTGEGTSGPRPTCNVGECDRDRSARGMCKMHYTRWCRHGDPNANLAAVANTCAVDDCGRPVHSHGMCDPHRARTNKYGDPVVEVPIGASSMDLARAVQRRELEQTVTCVDCGGPSLCAGFRRCLPCFQGWVAEKDEGRPERARCRSTVKCGTPSAAAKHRRKGEPLCPKCSTVGRDWLSRVAAA